MFQTLFLFRSMFESSCHTVRVTVAIHVECGFSKCMFWMYVCCVGRQSMDFNRAVQFRRVSLLSGRWGVGRIGTSTTTATTTPTIATTTAATARFFDNVSDEVC